MFATVTAATTTTATSFSDGRDGEELSALTPVVFLVSKWNKIQAITTITTIIIIGTYMHRCTYVGRYVTYVCSYIRTFKIHVSLAILLYTY